MCVFTVLLKSATLTFLPVMVTVTKKKMWHKFLNLFRGGVVLVCQLDFKTHLQSDILRYLFLPHADILLDLLSFHLFINDSQSLSPQLGACVIALVLGVSVSRMKITRDPI